MNDNSENLLDPQQSHALESLQCLEPKSPEDRAVITWQAAAENPAVARCCIAYAHARKTTLERRRSYNAAEEAAREAYRHALPALWGRERIRDFVACITQGLIMDVFTPQESKRLLYAAQIANSSTERTSVQHHPLSATKL